MSVTKPQTPPNRRARRGYLWLAVGGVAVGALILAIVLSAGDSGGGDVAAVTLTGELLPLYDAADPAAAVGMAAPEAEGQDFAGVPVAIEADGTPKAIVFLTHW